MEEEWKPFFGLYEISNYEISNFGRCRRIMEDGSYKEIKGSINRNGYRYIKFVQNKVRKNYMFHHAVAYQFIGERPEGLVIDHIDRDRLNNCVDNLRYVSAKENVRNSSLFRDDISEEDQQQRNKILQRESAIRCGRIKLKTRPTGSGGFKERDGKFQAYINIDGTRYNRTFTTKENAETFLIKMKESVDNIEAYPLPKRKAGTGNIIPTPSKKYEATIIINKKRHFKTCNTMEECEEFFKQMKELHG